MKKTAFALLLALLLGAPAARAQCEAGTRRVAFPRGRTTAVLRGRLVAGKEFCYRLRARAGQRMTLHLTSARRGVAAYNILAVYGGATKADAERVLRRAKVRYPGANVRRMRVLRGIT